MQRLEVLIAVMLSRERRAPPDAAASVTALAASLTALPSRPLEMVAEAVAALGHADATPRTSKRKRSRRAESDDEDMVSSMRLRSTTSSDQSVH